MTTRRRDVPHWADVDRLRTETRGDAEALNEAIAQARAQGWILMDVHSLPDGRLRAILARTARPAPLPVDEDDIEIPDR
jgi:DNA-binding IclR family transcriptional regulator